MHTFRKQERLCNHKTISQLYASDHRMLAFPLSVHWLILSPQQQASPLQVLIVAPKKKLHHAVDRNRTKRLMRECYRTRKHQLDQLMQQRGQAMALGINYIHTTPPDYHRLQHTFDKVFDKLCEQLEND